ncbi:polysaccharide lyase family 1 protein [Xylaria bambusicola]|uniref:polysaccharide lyase family 1 protein n=1 Tax=Xylaria bambusicola TaxID=326684 RepID=UPI002008E84D|nr:polysaccharide lyase family 1 protein [Xylaria bambusicola]KAI0517070.1 polysaccharide lyase family 1 protein [Xylaria bambusicola]
MMFYYALLALAPFVVACTNPDTDPCASFMTAQAATASRFCATFTRSTVTATTALPAWASVCSNKPTALSKECSCAFNGGTTTTTTKATTTTLTTTTRTTTGSGGGSTGSCSSPNYSLQGYGAGTTGGGSGGGTKVTSCDALESAAESGGVITISGVLDGCGIIDLASDTTVIGSGSRSGLTNGGLRIKRASNVILKNLYFHNPPKGKDLVEIQYSSKVWVDHCDFSTEGLTGDKDYYDGLLDITHGSDYITVSWNKFHDHWKGSLVGHSDSNSSEDKGKLHVTYHHNHFTNVNSRLPSFRFGTGHVYSSCFENNPTSGINSRMGAQMLIEGNYFSSTKRAIVTDLDSDQDGYAVERNNIFVDSTTEITQTGSLSPPYAYRLDPASCICGFVKSFAGLGVV